MALEIIRQTVSIDATEVKDGYIYHVNYSLVDGNWVSSTIKILKDTQEGSIECGMMNKDLDNTNFYMQNGEDIFVHSQILSDICNEIEEGAKKKTEKVK